MTRTATTTSTHSLSLLAGCGLALMLSACGGDGATGPAGANGASGAPGPGGHDSLAASVPEPAGAHCAFGGTRTSTGLDANGDGTLAATEVTSTTYVCNGAPGADLHWVDVTTTSTQAAANTGYVADNDAVVTITLPAMANVGDVIRISGAGAGGWRIAQNAGQRIETGFDNADWSALGASNSWSSVASSADGSRLLAGGNDLESSADAGASWNVTGAPTGGWYGLVSSTDGGHVAGLVNNAVTVSADGGATWSAAPLAVSAYWVGLASSGDGRELVTADYASSMYRSTDYGASWSAVGAAGTHTWSALASSGDGQTLVATAANDNIVLSSIDGGASWRTSTVDASQWDGVVVSADGTRVAAYVRNGGGPIYTSTDAGLTWTRTPSGVRTWNQLAISADGRVIAAAARAPGFSGDGALQLSTDGGASWTTLVGPGGHDWQSVALSSDGEQLVAASRDGDLVVARSSSSTGAAGYLTGRQYGSITLQYLGGGVFDVIACEGTISAH